MSPDAGEKLLHEYLAFVEEDQVADVATQAQPATPADGFSKPGEEGLIAVNSSSASIPYYAPFAPHFNPGLESRDGSTGIDGTSGWKLYRMARDVFAKLEKRDYACPTGTSNCSSIGYPNSCCQTGTERAKLNSYNNSGHADKHCCLNSRRIPHDHRNHHHRVATLICEHLFKQNNPNINKNPDYYHNNSLLYFHLKNPNPNNRNINKNLHQPRRTSPPNLHQHHHHHPIRLLPHRLLRLLSSPRRRLLPDRPRLSDHLLPVHGLHDHHLQQRDRRRSPDGRPLLHRHHVGVCRRVVTVSLGCGGDGWVLPGWV
ncbi:hypothetical protein VMCG_07892 [Cytospora schulzeri]|uniref:Uncharacterized protein n=1 Tax=Cytospora schulzeri TaxID=448051 RepID=A0A423W0S5_9PEZI|nr:hypothetical protein VMCG_07892 [Valsa malicola]